MWPDDVVLWTDYEIAIWRQVIKYEEEGDIASLAPLTTKVALIRGTLRA